MLLKDTKTDQGRWCSHACACRVSALSSACTRWMWCRTSSIGISGFVLTIAGRIFRCPAFTSSPSSVFRWTRDFCTDTSRYSKKARADTHSHGLPKKWRESVRRTLCSRRTAVMRRRRRRPHGRQTTEAGRGRRHAPFSTDTASHTLLDRSPAPYSPFPPRRPHSPTAFSGPMARPARAPCPHPQTGPPDSATRPVILQYLRALCASLCVLSTLLLSN